MMKRFLLFFSALIFLSCTASKEGDLVTAIEAKDKTKIKELLDKGADPNADASGAFGDGTTATFEAACTGDVELLQLLIDAGGKVDHVMEFGTKKIRLFDRLSFTIGHKLASCDIDGPQTEQYIEMINKVVDLGADIGANKELDLNDIENFEVDSEYDKHNAFYDVAASSSFGNSDISSSCSPLMKKILKTYIEHGASPDGKNQYNTTALIYHIQHDNIEMVRLLLELGADINVEGGDMDASPLWYALHVDLTNVDDFEVNYLDIVENDNEMTELLRSKGAKEICNSCS